MLKKLVVYTVELILEKWQTSLERKFGYDFFTHCEIWKEMFVKEITIFQSDVKGWRKKVAEKTVTKFIVHAGAGYLHGVRFFSKTRSMHLLYQIIQISSKFLTLFF